MLKIYNFQCFIKLMVIMIIIENNLLNLKIKMKEMV